MARLWNTTFFRTVLTRKTGTCVSVEIITKHWHVKPADKLGLYLIFKYCMCMYVRTVYTYECVHASAVCVYISAFCSIFMWSHSWEKRVSFCLIIWLIMLNFRLEVYLIGTCRWHFCPRNEVKMVHIFPSIIVTLLAFLFFLPFTFKSSLFTWQMVSLVVKVCDWSFYKYVLKTKWAKKKKKQCTATCDKIIDLDECKKYLSIQICAVQKSPNQIQYI